MHLVPFDDSTATANRCRYGHWTAGPAGQRRAPQPKLPVPGMGCATSPPQPLSSQKKFHDPEIHRPVIQFLFPLGFLSTKWSGPKRKKNRRGCRGVRSITPHRNTPPYHSPFPPSPSYLAARRALSVWPLPVPRKTPPHTPTLAKAPHSIPALGVFLRGCNW